MIPSVRETIEQAILLSVGAASLTRDRVEGVVAELVRQGRLSTDDGRAMVERLVDRAVHTDARTRPAGLVGQIESGLRAGLREAGLVTRADLDDLQVHLAELEHRIRLLEDAGRTGAPGSQGLGGEPPEGLDPATTPGE